VFLQSVAARTGAIYHGSTVDVFLSYGKHQASEEIVG
jgi:hypothetical protein